MEDYEEFLKIINNRINLRMIQFGIKDWQFKEDASQEMLFTLIECNDKSKEEKIGAVNNRLLTYIIEKYLPFYEFIPKINNRDSKGLFIKGSKVVIINIEEENQISLEEIMDLKDTLLKLTKEERQIITLIALGYTQIEIAEKMNCCRQTISKKIKVAQDKARRIVARQLGVQYD